MASRWSGAAGALVLVVAVGVHASAVPDAFIDDAYIAFRYAWNLSQGHGLVFNPGEPVEGYSSLVWVLLASGFLRAGIPLESGIRLTAVILLCLTTLLLRGLLVRLGVRPALAWLTGLLLASTSAWVIPMLNGLEGPLFSFLLLCLTALHVRSDSEMSRPSAFATGVVGLLLAATRPEGYLVYGAQVVTAAAIALHDRHSARVRHLALGLLSFLTGFALLTAWRVATYGSFTANSVHAKLGAQPFARFLSGSVGGGLHYTLDFAAAVLPLGLLVAAAAIHGWRRVPERESAIRTLAGLVVASWAIGVGVVLANNGDWMRDHRLLAPYLPLLALLPVTLTVDPPRRAIAIAAATGLLMLSPSRLDRPSLAPLLSPRPSAFHLAWCRLGADLQSAVPSPETTVVASEVIGAFGYCAPRLLVRDLSGLTDAQIARREPSGGVFGRKTRPATIEALRPNGVFTNDPSNWKRLVDESDWFRRDLVSLSCDALLSEKVYAFIAREGAFATATIPSCPTSRMAPAEAFQKAGCFREDWPYPATGACDPSGAIE